MIIEKTFDFSGKNIVITGGTKGIGRSIVKSFISLNAKVFSTYRQQDSSVEKIMNECDSNLKLIKIDATNSNASTDLLNWLNRRVKKVDVLINNVGDALKRSSFKNSDAALWHNCFAVNFFNTVDHCHKLFPLLNSANGSVIINISSIASKTSGWGDSLHYGVSKAAINSFTQGLAKEWGRYNIRVNGVAPSVIDTGFQKRLSSKKRIEKVIEQTPMGRIGTCDEVSSVVVFLSSNLASYISGDIVMVTGGR